MSGQGAAEGGGAGRLAAWAKMYALDLAQACEGELHYEVEVMSARYCLAASCCML
jgi:hypothetical protein